MINLFNFIKNLNRKDLSKYLAVQFITIIVFSIIYYVTNYILKENKKTFVSYLDTIYFTIVTHFSVGYGDITPKNKLHKLLAIIQIITSFIISLY